jgi:hypothetical protein
MRSPLVWRQLHWPRPLDAAAALSAIRAWAADEDSPQLVLEARASTGSVEYLLGCPAAALSSVMHRLVTAIPATRTTALPSDRAIVSMASQLRLTSRHRPLRTDLPESTTRQVLGALSRADQDELLVLQLCLGPRRVPLAIPNQSPSSVVMPWYQVAWLGTGKTIDGEKRAALRSKVGDHGFAASLRLGAVAGSADRRRDLINGLYTALRVGETPGLGLSMVPGSAAPLNSAHAPWRWPLRLNVSEVLACSAWPVGDDDLPGLVPLHPRQIAPTALARRRDRVVARALAPGVDGMLGYSVTDSLRHTWVLGPNGTGKTTLLLNLIDQDLRAGRAVVVIEPKDLIRDLLLRIPDSRLDDVVLLDCLDQAPVGINPLQRHGRHPEVVADSLFALFASLYGEALGPRSSDILHNCLNVLAESDEASLVMLPLLLTHTAFRRSLTAGSIQRDPIVAAPFWAWFEGLTSEARAQVTAPLQNKLRPLLRPYLRGVLGQRRPRFNIRQVLSEQKVLLVPLQKGAIGPDTAELLGVVVLNELWLAIRERTRLPQAARRPVMIYLDELQDYLRSNLDLADALATSRSLGAAWHAAHQHRDQLDARTRAALSNNARNRICFTLAADDGRAMAAGQSVLEPADFTSLPAFHIYSQLLRDNNVQPWASGVSLPPPEVCSDPEVVRASSRNRYGRDRTVIEADFAQLIEQSSQPAAPTTGRRRRSQP